MNRTPSEQDPELIGMCRSLGADWFLFPATTPIPTLAQWRALLTQSDHLIVGVDSDELVARRAAPFEERLAALGRTDCDAVLLQDVETDSLKAGRPFHRLAQLRDAGLTKFIFLDAINAEVAEWMVENTPARAVAVPFGLADQNASFRLVGTAAEMGTKLLSRRVRTPKIDVDVSLEKELSFRMRSLGFRALIEPLPDSSDELSRVALVGAGLVEMSWEEHDRWWKAYTQKVPPPPKPKRGHPPEYGS